MVREETGVENLPFNCWYINFTSFDYINYQEKKLFAEENIAYQMIIYKDLILQIHNYFLWIITEKYPKM